MHGSASVGWLLAVCSAVTGALCLLRTRGAAGGRRRAAGGEAFMGFGMAAMAVAAVTASPPWVWPVCAAAFAAAAAHAAWYAYREPHQWHHLVGAAAMVHMAVTMAAAPAGHAGHGGMADPFVSGALLLYFAGHTLISGARLIPAPGLPAPEAPGHTGGPAATGWLHRPETARACRLSMSTGMLAMLLAM